MEGKIGLQLFSLRKALNDENFIDVLQEVKKIGYEGVELLYGGGFKDIYNKTPQEIGKAINKSGLKAISSHVAYDSLKENLEEVIEYHKEAGCQFLIIPTVPDEKLENEKSIKETAKEFRDLSEKVRKHGFELGYHNHGFELKKVNDETILEILAKELEGEVSIQLDIGKGLPVKAGKYLERLNTKMLAPPHIADARENDGNVRLGQGNVDIPEFVERASERGVQWFIVEDGGSDNPMDAVKMDFKYMNSL